MKKHRWTGRLPNETSTYSQSEYVSEWEKLYKKVLKFFPGYQVHSYDPGLYLISCENHQDTLIKRGDLNLTMHNTRALLKSRSK